MLYFKILLAISAAMIALMITACENADEHAQTTTQNQPIKQTAKTDIELDLYSNEGHNSKEGHNSAPLTAFFDCVDDRNGLLISAHRGRVDREADNSLATLNRLIDLNIPMAEIDIRQTKDGVLVLRHDDELERSTTGHGLISEKNWADIDDVILTWNRYKNQNIPQLEQALELARGKLIVQLDIKNTTNLGDVIDAVVRQKMENQVIFITYNRKTYRRLRATNANFMVSLNAGELDLEKLDADEKKKLLLFFDSAEQHQLEHAAEKNNIETIYATFLGPGNTDRAARKHRQLDGYQKLYRHGAEIIATNEALLVNKALESEVKRSQTCWQDYKNHVKS